jgi:hypothetical protein
VGLTYLPTKLLEDSRRNKKKEKKRKREIEGGKKKGKASLRRGVGREGEMGGDKEMATERTGSSPSSPRSD